MHPSLFFIVVGLSIAHGRLTINSKITGGSLKVTCTLENKNDFQYVMSLVISKSENGKSEVLASLNKFSAVNSLLPDDVKVTGYVSDDISDLAIQWDITECNFADKYTCTAAGLDQNNLPGVITEELNLNLTDLDPLINVAPTHIQVGVTSSLTVECSLINASCYDMEQLAQVKILHNLDGVNRTIASLDDFGPRIIEADKGWTVLASYNKRQFPAIFLAVQLQNPTLKDAGTYSCDLTGFQNGSDLITNALRTIDITASVAPTQNNPSSLDTVGGREDYYLFACNFENGLCGLKLNTSENAHYSWSIVPDRLMALSGYFDKPLHHPDEHYLFIDNEADGMTRTATIESELITPNGKSICFSFWFFKTSDETIKVYALRNNSLIRDEVYRDYLYGPGWTKASGQVPFTNDPFTLMIETVYYSKTEHVAVDDILISDIFCKY